MDWFRRHLRLRGGIPSADTFARVFRRLDPDEFLRCLSSWVESLRTRISGEVVAIDGQTLRGSDDRAFGGRGPLPLVRAWATKNRRVLGQQACGEESNATPKVQYAYEDGSNNTILATTLTYPNGRELTYDYGTADEISDASSRIASLILRPMLRTNLNAPLRCNQRGSHGKNGLSVGNDPRTPFTIRCHRRETLMSEAPRQ